MVLFLLNIIIAEPEIKFSCLVFIENHLSEITAPMSGDLMNKMTTRLLLAAS
jgi:hypothetical protein